MRNLRLDICYDGTRYRGWQRLPGVEATIQGKLETALSRILGERIEVSGSGRTDAGVHAAHQIASFHCESSLDCGRILSELRRYLPEDIGIYSCQEAAPRFHARLNARAKTYRYRIWNSETPCVFERRFVTILPEPLDLEEMNRAAALLLGEHDFSAFCGNPKMKKSTVRLVDSITIKRSKNQIYFTFHGTGFLQHMVRILVGTLLEVGAGRFQPEDMTMILEAKDRRLAGPTAPACGLCLEKVDY